VDWPAAGGGAILSGISVCFCIHDFPAFIKRLGMPPFLVDRLLLGGWQTWLFR